MARVGGAGLFLSLQRSHTPVYIALLKIDRQFLVLVSSLGQSAGVNHLLSSLMQGFNKDRKNVDSIEMIIDKKIKDMEQRMMAKIEERLGRLEKQMKENISKMFQCY